VADEPDDGRMGTVKPLGDGLQLGNRFEQATEGGGLFADLGEHQLAGSAFSAWLGVGEHGG
jgi:hypothetical protein